MRIERRKIIKQAMTAVLGASLLSRSLKSRRASADANPPLILSVRVAGGWDPTMVFDSKVGVAGIAQESSWQSANISSSLKIVTHTNRPSVTSFFENFGGECIVLNGIHTQSIEHDRAFDLNHSMSISSALHRRSDRRADPLTAYAYAVNSGLNVPHLNINSRLTSGSLSAYCHSVNNEDINRYLSGSNSGSSGLSSPSNTALQSYLGSAYSRQLAAFPSVGLDSEKIDNLARVFSREEFFMTNMNDIVTEIASTSTVFERNLKIAMQMMAQGYTLSVSVGDGQFYDWDTHTDHFSKQSIRFESLFSELSKAVLYAKSLNLYERMIIVVSSDVGRCPILNSNTGKDHWPYSSALLISPMLNASRMIGSTDDNLRGLPINDSGTIDITSGKLITMAQVYSALFQICDLDPTEYFVDGTPLTTMLEES
jgi:hypothetical protein